jgi:hypothetical protein
MRRDLRERVVPFTAGDGFECNLVHVRGPREPDRGPVLLVHGAGVRANLFRPPLATTLVDVLVDRGFDVWLENWRASIDLPANRWTLDQAALHDHPQAVATVVRETGASSVQALIHCQGSTSFMMSAVAGLVPQVRTIVSNAVSLHPVVPWTARLKGALSVPAVAALTDYLDPRWGLQAPTPAAKLISAVVALTHHECDNPVCKQVSFTYGVGFPTLWSHANLDDATHEWIKGEFARVPMTFFQQMRRCIAAGRLLAVDGLPGLPADFAAQPPRTDARIAFFAGQDNRCFLARSQELSFAHFDRLQPERHSLHVIPGYGHLDVFLGKNAARDVFPRMLAELEAPVAEPGPAFA